VPSRFVSLWQFFAGAAKDASLGRTFATLGAGPSTRLLGGCSPESLKAIRLLLIHQVTRIGNESQELLLTLDTR
jgi:hypothetical protein